MDKIQLSSLELDPSSPFRRAMPRPAHLRQSTYEDEFDFRTIFYDCFASADGTWRIFLGPPLLNLEPIVLPTVPNTFRCRSSSDVLLKDNVWTSQLWLRTGKNQADLSPGTFRQSELTIQPNHFDLFRDRRVLLTLSKDNDLQWIRDWVLFFARKHGADAVLFYDNASTKYEISTIQETISSIHGIQATAVVHWPFKYGPQGWSGSPALPWDSNFSQYGVLEHARHRFLSLAEAVVNADVDELVITRDGTSVFDLVNKSCTGYLQYGGHWIEGAKDSSDANGYRHSDFVYRFAVPTEITSKKWAIAPRWCPPYSFWRVHEVSGMQPDMSSEAVSHRHFRAINTGWYKGEGAWIEKYPRGKIERPNECVHVRDDELISWMQVLKLPEEESWANYLSAKATAREQEAKLLASKLAAQEVKLAAQEVKLAALEANLQSVLHSISWQATKPMRKLHNLFPTIGGVAILILKLFWWALTFKLFRKIAPYLNQSNHENVDISHGQDAKVDAYAPVDSGSQVQDDAFASVWDDLSISRRRDLLRRIHVAADKSGVCPHLYAGTLLGYVREGKILDWDDDIDLALFSEENLHEFATALGAEGLRTRSDPKGPNNIKIYDESYEPIPGWEHCTWPYVNIFVFQRKGDVLVCEAQNDSCTVLRSRVLPSKRSSSFEGCVSWVPEDETYMLDIFYPDWKTYEVSSSWNHRLEKPSIRETQKRAIETVNGRKTLAGYPKFEPKNGLENLVIAREVFADLGVRYFLMDGTLLGLVRDGKFIERDDEDLDIGLFAEDFDLVTFCLLVTKMIEKGFDPVWGGCTDSFGKSFVLPWWRKGVKLDLDFYVRLGDRRIIQCAYKNLRFWYPADMIERLCPVEFLGEVFMVPEKKEAVLAHQYGDWKTPKVMDWDWSTSPLNIVQQTNDEGKLVVGVSATGRAVLNTGSGFASHRTT
jgi:hypothetical protein